MKISATPFLLVLFAAVLSLVGVGGPAPVASASDATSSRKPSDETTTPTREETSASSAQKKSVEKIVPAQIMFDDFSYTDQKALMNHGWIVRTAPGWPGVPGAMWWREGV